MADAGLAVNENWIVFGQYRPEDGESAARRLMMLKDRPSAVFCFSDEMAIGCMHALKEQGFKVPSDMSVMGFDGIPFARYAAPPLTTIAQPTERIGADDAPTWGVLVDDLITSGRLQRPLEQSLRTEFGYYLLLRDNLDGRIRIDEETSRRLFTLICVLHIRG